MMMLTSQFLRLVGIVAVSCSVVVGAQAGRQTRASPAFEVASIKLDQSGSDRGIDIRQARQ